jgi:hypothetical protein
MPRSAARPFPSPRKKTNHPGKKQPKIKTMKTFYLIPLLFLSACSTTPKLALRPQPPPPMDNSAVRYPEVLRAYHVGRYVDPERRFGHARAARRLSRRGKHALEFSSRPIWRTALSSPHCRRATRRSAPAPVNDAILAEVNSQKARHHPNHDAGPNPVGGAGAVSSRVAADQNQFAGNGGFARDGERDEEAARCARNRAGATAASPISTTNEPPIR